MIPKHKLLSDFNPGLTHPLYLIRNRLLKSLQLQIPKLKGKIMDFGCGIKPYEPLFVVDEYIGVDFIGEGQTYAKTKVDVIYDGKTLPFPDEVFDSIFSTEVAEHIFNLEDIIIELQRVLKKDGTILLTCPFTMPEHEAPNDFARYTSFAIGDILKRNGFEIIHYEKTGNFIEALFQLQIIYWDQSILKIFRKIPVVRTVLRKGVYGLFNLTAVVCSEIFPINKGLYLNNVIMAKKL